MNNLEPGEHTPLSASVVTGGKADVFLGTHTYYPCNHKFSWHLDHLIPGARPQRVSISKCPKCSPADEARCPVCLQSFEAKTHLSCPSCDNFFDQSLLRDRRQKLEELGIRVVDEKPYALRAYVQLQKDVFQRKWGSRHSSDEDQLSR
ncbi:hypothetical protein F4778DRAFT_762834 [Xylariomycetidae sp. FL2044]|nr:hypothetical protein F4778DRAFT_762834 [Xylariomycetidae sp. FL2044]